MKDKEELKTQTQQHTLSEKQLRNLLNKKRKVLLVEPNYKRKYIPLGLAKISTYIKNQKGKVTFARSDKLPNDDFDCVCVTSLFTYDSEIVLETLNKIKKQYKKADILVGGVYASLMPEHIIKYTGRRIKLFQGCADFLDNTPIDYSIDWQLEEPWNDFSFCFTSRGCPNKCAYCAVWRIETIPKIVENWKAHIQEDKKNVMISDNNLSAQSFEHIKNVIDFLSDANKHVVFDNGFDCKHITLKMAKQLSRLKFIRSGMRLAFDRIEEDGIFQEAVQILIDSGIPKTSIMAYVLFNFTDTPKEANYRMSECLRLGIRQYPQRYTPLNYSTRKQKYVGKYWSENLIRVFRHFWLMGGLFRKTTFDDFIMNTEQFTITEHDKALYFEGEKNADSKKNIPDQCTRKRKRRTRQ